MQIAMTTYSQGSRIFSLVRANNDQNDLAGIDKNLILLRILLNLDMALSSTEVPENLGPTP